MCVDNSIIGRKREEFKLKNAGRRLGLGSLDRDHRKICTSLPV